MHRDLNRVICDYREGCSEQSCGAAVPHREQDCEPCPFNSDAKCLPITWEEKKELYLLEVKRHFKVNSKPESDLVMVQGRWFKINGKNGGSVFMEGLE